MIRPALECLQEVRDEIEPDTGILVLFFTKDGTTDYKTANLKKEQAVWLLEDMKLRILTGGTD